MASPVTMALPKTIKAMATTPAISTISIWIAMEIPTRSPRCFPVSIWERSAPGDTPRQRLLQIQTATLPNNLALSQRQVGTKIRYAVHGAPECHGSSGVVRLHHQDPASISSFRRTRQAARPALKSPACHHSWTASSKPPTRGPRVTPRSITSSPPSGKTGGDQSRARPRASASRSRATSPSAADSRKRSR